jgi:Fe-S cluster assembly protein SufD
MTQYIDFFKSQKQKINECCSPLLNSFRERAFETFRQSGFPACQSENYRYTDIADLLKSDFGFYLNRTKTNMNPRKIFPCTIPNLSSYKRFIINGQYFEEEIETDLPQGVFSGSLHDFTNRHPQIFSEYYDRQASRKGDGLTAFNTMFVQDGYVLYVPENVIVEKPFQITNISAGNVDSLVNRRILIVLEPGAEAKLLVCDHAPHEKNVWAATQVVEIYAAENTSFDFYELEESGGQTIRLTSNFVRQAESSQVMVNSITLSNGITRNNYQVDLMGNQAGISLYGMAIADARQKIDNFTLINHQAPDCRSKELFKYILEDEAIGAFDGRIVVAKGAQKTQAYQSNRNLLGNSSCRMYAKPQLEIYADDVKCSHGMTTGRLDEAVLFYMQSRGIPKDEAVLLLKLAFVDDVIQGIRLEGLRDRLKLLVERRFRGELIKCQGYI